MLSRNGLRMVRRFTFPQLCMLDRLLVPRDRDYQRVSVRASTRAELHVIWIILLLTILTVAVIASVMAPRMADGRVLYGKTPDGPCPFGYRMSWLAVRTRNTRKVVEILGLGEVEACNWQSGIGAAYDAGLGQTRLFVSPPVNGWTFVVGLALPQPLGAAFVDKNGPLLLRLGEVFIEVQYYFAYPMMDFFAWARLIDGRLVRGFAISDEGVIWNVGKPSKDERSLGLKLFDVRGPRGRKGDAGGPLIMYPTEDHVMRLAGRWGIDPIKVDVAPRTKPALGYIGTAPSVWRSERVRKAAA